MQKIIVNIDSSINAGLFLKMVKQLSFVESVKIEDKELNWEDSLQEISDADCETMVVESEAEYDAGLFIPIEDAREQVLDGIEKWWKESVK